MVGYGTVVALKFRFGDNFGVVISETVLKSIFSLLLSILKCFAFYQNVMWMLLYSSSFESSL